MARPIYTSPGRMAEEVAKLHDPENWGYQSSGMVGENITMKRWPNRAALRQTIAMQERGPHNSLHWKMVIRENPALLVGLNPRRNPLPGTSVRAGDRISDRVYEVAYRHDEDGEDYKHEFKAGVELWTVTLGKAKAIVIVGKDQQDLWRDF